MNLEKIIEFITVESIDLDLKATNKTEVLLELTKLLEKSGKLENFDKTLEALKDREKLGSTGIGKGVAIPHAKTEFAKDLVIAFGVSKHGINFNAVDDEKVNIFFVFASPLKNSQTYLKILARISRLIRNDEFREKLLNSKTPSEVLELINYEENN